MPIIEELRAAVGAVSGLTRLAAGVSPAAVAGGVAFYPLVGLAVGALAAGAARSTVAAGALTAVVAVGVLEIAGGPRLRRGVRQLVGAVAGDRLGAVVVVASVLAKAWAVAVMPASGRPLALLLAPVLARWAMAVQCYGGTRPGSQRRDAEPVVRAGFREFGWASTTAIGTALVALDAVGLVVVLLAALTTLGLRVVAHRRLGGTSAALVGGTGAVTETLVLLALAGVGRMLR